MLILLIFFFMVVIAVQVPGMLRQGMWKELVVYSILMAVAMALSFAETLDITLPNPTGVTEVLFEPVSKFVHGLLHIDF